MQPLHTPLAERLRPQKLQDMIGQDHLIGPDKILTRLVKQQTPANLIFWGPPGTGKTTLARILAQAFKADFTELSAVTASKKDIEQVITRARQNWNLKTHTLLFVDEIHRFNKAQQDAFLPHVESGLITLIGATTENPSFEVISPLISRSRVIVLKPLDSKAITKIIKRAIKLIYPKQSITKPALEYLANLAHGDARFALNTLELAFSLSKNLDLENIKQAAGKSVASYDKSGDNHYNNISAFIKSMRGQDVDAALYYLARMIEGGEDPKFIARRMIIFASEDIGLAGNGALSLATSTFDAVERIGLPEAGIVLAHAAVALTRSKKDRSSYDAWQAAKALAKDSMHLPVPSWICNAPTKLMQDLGYAKDYKWEAGFHANKNYLPDKIKDHKIYHYPPSP